MRIPQDTDEQRLALAQRFAHCDAAHRDWAEGLAYKNLESRIASAGAISSRVQAMITVLLGVLAGAGALALRVFETPGSPAAWGAVVAGVYACGVLLYMVRAVVTLQDAPAVYNRPANLLVPGVTQEQVRLGELANLDERIRQQSALNAARAGALNAVYLASAAIPLVFAAGCVAAWAVTRL